MEKDYWVTEVLRGLFAAHRGELLFKGGTSLSKGWKLIQRFSEDIDLLLLSEPGAPTDALLDRLTVTATEVSLLEPVVESEVQGHARRIALPFPRVENVRNASGMRKDILLEPGVRGGPKPQAIVSIRPLLADGLPPESIEEFDDLGAFELDALHPARTFVEKLFAVDSMATRLMREPERVVRGTEARHFYDLFFLAEPDGLVLTYLASNDEYMELVADCEEVSRRWYPGGAMGRPQGGFANSAAFNDPGVASRVASAFDRAMRDLCYPDAQRPSLEEVSQRLRAISWL